MPNLELIFPFSRVHVLVWTEDQRRLWSWGLCPCWRTSSRSDFLGMRGFLWHRLQHVCCHDMAQPCRLQHVPLRCSRRTRPAFGKWLNAPCLQRYQPLNLPKCFSDRTRFWKLMCKGSPRFLRLSSLSYQLILPTGCIPQRPCKV